jgi:hypothetical protein
VTTSVEISSLQQIQELLTLLEADNEIILMQANMPVAKVLPVHTMHVPESGRVPDMHPNVWVSDDFDEQVPEKYWDKRTL